MVCSQNLDLEGEKIYFSEKSRGGKKRHERTDIIKNNIIKPMFENMALIRGKSTKQRADKIHNLLSGLFSMEDENINISEEAIIDFALKSIEIPQHILLEIGDELKKSSNKEHKHQMQESNKLQKQYEQIQTRIKKVRELYIDQDFTKEEYNESMTDLQVQRQNIETRLSKLSNADDSFNKNVSTIFELASKAYELFKSSDIDEKRRILVLLFPNLQMNGGKLMLEPRKPFDVFFNNANRQDWLLGRDSNSRPRD